MMVFFQPSNTIIHFSLQIIMGLWSVKLEICILNTSVKAMAGAKHLCQLLNKVLDNSKPKSINRKTFFLSLKEKYLSTVHKINKLNEKVYEIIIKSPKASHMFKPGQFFKLQNYHSKNKKPFEPINRCYLYRSVEMGGSREFAKA